MKKTHLIKKIDRNIVNLLLPIGLVLIIFSFILPQYKSIQAGLALTFIYLYVGLSLLHHREDKSLTLEVTLEYILIATLTLVILLGVII